MKKLLFVALMCFFFMICEIIGGLISGSLAILTDAAHMFSDVTGVLISFAAVYLSRKKATMESSMGNYRAEILGAVLAILLIWGLLIWVDIEAYKRIMNPPPPLDAEMMLTIACIGLFFNLLNFFALEADCGKKDDEGEDEDDELNLHRVSFLGKSSSMVDEEPARESMDKTEGTNGVTDFSKFKDDEDPQIELRKNLDDHFQAINMKEVKDEVMANQKKDQKEKKERKHDPEAGNYNVRAALLHIIGDMV